MDNHKHDEIVAELRRIQKLLVLIATKDQKQKEQIKLLNSMGFQPKEIGELLGTTANAIRVTLYSIRKKGKPQKAKVEQPPN